MAATLLLDQSTWDLVLDASGNIALATEPYSLAQDAASAARTFQGEVFWDTTVGVDLFGSILGQAPVPALIKQLLVSAALTVPDVTSARVVLNTITNRQLSGQIQVTGPSGTSSIAPFVAVSPAG